MRPPAADIDAVPDAHLDAVFAALADPTRRAIVTRLLAGDRTVSELAAPFEMSLAAVSKHLGILTRAGLVAQRREGRTKFCRLEIDSLRPAAVWMEAFGSFDAADLDTLEALFALAERLPDPDAAAPGADAGLDADLDPDADPDAAPA
ncbi:metalloregulator ArsR/SmtB family transcription factor [Rhodobacteraceae bacterium 2CG4]|uniref:Metalloregulator ArsR/SmtB family transcription factor n=1 Tax=Halovulum marinum TaxID=2662447 RepID=A0A6L5Z5F1_9RHOB|nr:metalloregulator ArsR/SmtB family transcription factor [Halovulum marinum]MSU91330.1 metalloregulator ArsR/SmtB family transcription factor [Halovulum marinum]